MCKDIIYNFIISKGTVETYKDFFTVRKPEGHLKSALTNFKLLVGLPRENAHTYSLNFQVEA